MTILFEERGGAGMLRRAKAAVSRRLQFSLFAQGYILIANQVAAAGLGMIYWAVAGRLYSSAEVGRAASALSLIMLISLVAEFGAKGMFVRYVPALGRERRAFVLVCYLLIASAAGLIAYAVQLFNLDRAFGNISDSTGCSWFVGASIAISIFYVQDGVLIAMRRSWLVLAQNVSFNVSKLLIIILLGYYAVQNAILISWFTPIPAFIILTSIVIFRRRPPVVADGQRKSRESYAEIARQTAWYYLSGLINETAGRVLPLIIIQQVGSSAAAYFFQAWLIASTLRFLSTSLASSFTVLVAETPSALAASARKALLFMTGVTALAVGGVVLLAPYILLIIGREYAEHATGILRLLALSAIPYAISIWMAAYARLAGSGRCILAGNIIQAVGTIGLSLLWIPDYGLEGAGLACLLAQTVALAPCYGLVLSAFRATEGLAQSSVARAWRRLDWRFLTRNPWPRSVACQHAAIAQDLQLICADVAPLESIATLRDLVIIEDISRDTISHAQRNLRPTGALVWVGPIHRLARAQRRVVEAGLDLQAAYLGTPNLRRALLFASLPVRWDIASFALAYRLSSRSPWIKRITHIAGGLLAFVANLRLIGQVMLVAHVPAERTSGHDEGAFHQHAAQGLTVAPGRRVDSAICAFVWSQSGGVSPAFVTKRARKNSGDQFVAQEARILRLLERSFPPTDRLSVPRLIYESVVAGCIETSQTYMPGVQIDRAKVDFAHAAALATEFQMVLGLQTMQTATGAHGDFEAALSALCAAGLLDEEDRRRAADRLEPLAHSPSVVAHNDFTPWNVLLDGEHLGVIDWGEAQEHGYVGVDLACMLCHLAFAKEGAQDRDAIVDLYEAIVVRKGTYGAMIDRLLRRYLAALGLDATLVAALRLMTWVYRADCELQLTKAEAGASALETLSERSIILGLLRAELALDHAEVSATSENAE